SESRRRMRGTCPTDSAILARTLEEAGSSARVISGSRNGGDVASSAESSCPCWSRQRGQRPRWALGVRGLPQPGQLRVSAIVGSPGPALLLGDLRSTRGRGRENRGLGGRLLSYKESE